VRFRRAISRELEAFLATEDLDEMEARRFVAFGAREELGPSTGDFRRGMDPGEPARSLTLEG
jgi:hypothetical protein